MKEKFLLGAVMMVAFGLMLSVGSSANAAITISNATGTISITSPDGSTVTTIEPGQAIPEIESGSTIAVVTGAADIEATEYSQVNVIVNGVYKADVSMGASVNITVDSKTGVADINVNKGAVNITRVDGSGEVRTLTAGTPGQFFQVASPSPEVQTQDEVSRNVDVETGKVSGY